VAKTSASPQGLRPFLSTYSLSAHSYSWAKYSSSARELGLQGIYTQLYTHRYLLEPLASEAAPPTNEM
jgi:hypothetical protein